MGKKTRTGTGGRRTILQLFPPRSGTVCGREDSLGSVSEEGLSLLGAYEDSDEEEDADFQPPTVRTQHQSADILANFMAEIDAITTQPGSEEPTGDRSAPAPTPPRPEPKAQQHASEMGTELESTGVDFQYDTHTSLAGVGGLEMGDWQEVWDDNTGCYYYWNTQTNEVAWQLPYYLAHQVQGLQQYADSSSTVNGNGATQSAGCYAEQHSTAVSALTSKTKKEVMESVVALTSEEEERRGVAASLLGPLIPAAVKEAEERWRKRLVGGLEERENSLEDSLPGSPAPPLNEPDTPAHPLRDQRSRNQSEEDSDAEEMEEDTMELELALDRKKAELRALEEGDCSAGGSSPCSEASQEATGPRSLLLKNAKWKTAFLRAASPDSNSRGSDTREDPDTAHSKVPEKAGEEEDKETGDKTVTKVPPKEEVETPELKIGELANTLTSKMEFLGINKITISNFQLLLLQTETRIADWREGALNGIYLRRRLQEAAEHIKHYELNAAPKGWSCHWDREQRRYFYTYDRTSASQWDFPAEEEREEGAKASIQEEPKPPPVPTGGLAVAGASIFTPIVPPQPGLPSYWSVPQPPLPPDQPPPPADSPPPPPPPPESPPPLPPPPLDDDGEIEEVEMEEDDDDDSEPPAPGTEPPLPPGFVGMKVVESSASLGKSQKRKASGAGQLTKAATIGSSAILYTQTTAAPVMSGAAYWGVSASKKSKTKMPSLVKKWQSIQKELDEEEQSSSSDEDRDQLNKRSIEEWKQQQLLTGKAGKNANFEALPDDWRERLLKKRKMMKNT
ncbi:unnamed protein product [Coregonus sp. 'balchen']|nr:unnamed protein product [Coregonus sp. 'balchen']